MPVVVARGRQLTRQMPCAQIALQVEFIKAIRSQIGFNNKTAAKVVGSSDDCPYERFMCLNSGSEAVELSTRITDVVAKKATAAGGVHAGRKPRLMCLEGSFYGRTYRPARLSHVCRSTYQEHLASFTGLDDDELPIVVAPNDIPALEAAFAKVWSFPSTVLRPFVHFFPLWSHPTLLWWLAGCGGQRARGGVVHGASDGRGPARQGARP